MDWLPIIYPSVGYVYFNRLRNLWSMSSLCLSHTPEPRPHHWDGFWLKLGYPSIPCLITSLPFRTHIYRAILMSGTRSRSSKTFSIPSLSNLNSIQQLGILDTAPEAMVPWMKSFGLGTGVMEMKPWKSFGTGCPGYGWEECGRTEAPLGVLFVPRKGHLEMIMIHVL